MDVFGLARRVLGLAGIALVYFGVKDQAAVDSAMQNITVVTGGAMFLLDFGKSVFDKLSGK